MNKFRFCHASSELRQDLDNYSKCEDCERDSAYVKHRSESVFDKSSDEEM